MKRPWLSECEMMETSGPAIPALAGQSGALTISHDGGYGQLAGKAIALEPATGFSFDSPLVNRPR